jgi:hypothetical protein
LGEVTTSRAPLSCMRGQGARGRHCASPLHQNERQPVWLVVDVGPEIIALRFKIKGAPSLPVNMAAGRAGGKGTELWAQSNPSDFKARGSWASACANDDGRLDWKTFSASRWYIASDKIAAELPAKRASNDGHRPR